jgi:hypothetical protein
MLKNFFGADAGTVGNLATLGIDGTPWTPYTEMEIIS